MVSVEPIRSAEKIREICKYLKMTNERNYILFLLGIYSGLRISDILRLQVKDVKGKSHFVLREKKTGKMQKLVINDQLKKELKWYCAQKRMDDYLIPSRQAGPDGKERPICRDQALKIMKQIGKAFGEDNLGCHSMRKSFGYHYYRRTGDIATLQRIFNHATSRITLIYLGIEQAEKDKAMKKFRY